MSDRAFAAALLAAQPVAWLLAWLLARVMPLRSSALREWRRRQKELSPGDRVRVKGAVDRGRAPEDPRLRSYAAIYARSRLDLLQEILKNRAPWLGGLAFVLLVHITIATWLAVRNEWVAALIVITMIALALAVVLLNARRRRVVLRRAIEANAVDS